MLNIIEANNKLLLTTVTLSGLYLHIYNITAVCKYM